MPILVLVPMVIGAAIGLVTRYLVPGREWVGLLLSPSAAASAAGIVWTVLGLLGLSTDNGWLWIASLSAALVVALVLPRLLPARRAREDAAYLAELTRTTA